MCFNVLSGTGFGDRHFQLPSSFDISDINYMSIFHKDELVFMTEYVFVTAVEKTFIYLKKNFILPFVSVMWKNNH